jgi:hypothetical protein
MCTRTLAALTLGLADALLLAPRAEATTRFEAYAAAGTFGPWYDLPGQLGPLTYVVRYGALGRGTAVTAEVKYAAADGQEVIVPFNDSVAFRTGNFAAVPKVRFRGIPFGSAVTVIVSP